ncbi:helix-hairpin-helix domain-containing protein [Arsukibacterium sp.]|uniref:ComEA family DNA-binding protein n=1 Tax=Arsukibacterium sp. TaxID=1977258 RepID=UPI00299EF74A|nr:helix-hairpin-helix domain-containing protein [Arsukibacterium sp.]MDX1676981.1 helix-hairpin-helix domain-containing protein [Arsukibacterium sp.]
MKNVAIALLLTGLTLAANQTLAAKPGVTVDKQTATAQQQQKLNLNKASAEQLEAIPGIGKSKAQAIMAYIQQNGPIANQQQLTEVKGIGDKLAAKIAQYVSFD